MRHSLFSLAALLLLSVPLRADDTPIVITTPMPPPPWALLERELLRANADACREFYAKYFDDRGYLLCVERWGGDDGPDDAIENLADWPLLHALGGPDSVLKMYRTAWEGHLRQYTLAKTTDVPFAKDGMYYKEFPVMFDWMHNGEGLRVFNLQGLSDPYDNQFGQRVKRYAGFYMNEDPGAPNYDPKHKIIRSMFNGSRGPLLRKATGLDWAGDPIEIKNRFLPAHGERSYEEMLFHFKDYNDIVGDHPQNLSATTLALNAYLLTGDKKYKTWLLEYTGAWLDRMKQNNGIIPSNIGLDGTIGGAAGGKWYGGVYGWGFSVEDAVSHKMIPRNNVGRAILGFGNAYLLTGDRRFVDPWSAMIDQVNAQAKLIDGEKQYPHMYGDKGWYEFKKAPWNHGDLECWFWTDTEKDHARVANDPWVRYLDGKNSDYPERALQTDFAMIRDTVAAMRKDPTTPDTRLADDPARYNPAAVSGLRELMMAALDPGRGGGPLHCRLRYFDPAGKRAGIPPDVAALIDRVGKDQVAVTLVNVNQLQPRTVVVQTGGYGEDQCREVDANGQRYPVGQPYVTVRLEPGTGARLILHVDRYANDPTLVFPWDRRWKLDTKRKGE